MSQTQREATVEATQDSGLIGEDSCVDVGFNTEIDDMEADLNDRRSNLPKRISKSITGAPDPKVETYSKPLQDQIRYVQYIPKEAKGTIEDVVNQLYHTHQIKRKLNGDDASDNSTMTKNSP